MALTVRQWRRAKEISQEQMAEQLNIHVNTYMAWEANPGKIRIDAAAKISEILGVPVEEIDFSADPATQEQ